MDRIGRQVGFVLAAILLCVSCGMKKDLQTAQSVAVRIIRDATSATPSLSDYNEAFFETTERSKWLGVLAEIRAAGGEVKSVTYQSHQATYLPKVDRYTLYYEVTHARSAYRHIIVLQRKAGTDSFTLTGYTIGKIAQE